VNSKCRVCGTVLDPEGEGVRVCPTCKGASHEECWGHLGGCIEPSCRRAATEERTGGPLGMPMRRRGALIRRRLAWIVAHELHMVPEFHPDERRYSVGALACVLLAGAAEVLELELLLQLFGPGAILMGGLLLLHRRQRRKGYIHRWIPAGPAPAQALEVADWVLFVEEGGEGGRPVEQFGEDYLATPRERTMFDDAVTVGLLKLAKAGGKPKVFLAANGAKPLEEARSRVGPRDLESTG